MSETAPTTVPLPAEAEKLYDRVRENPGRASAYKELARLLRSRGEHRNAAAVLRRGLKNLPGDLELLQHLALTQQEGGFSAAAVRTWKLITREHPDHYLAYEKLERHYVRAGKPGRALSLYRGVSEEADFKEKSLERTVFVAKEAGDVPGTLKALKKLVRRFGVTRERARDLGRYCFKAERHREASHWLEKAFALGEDDRELRLLAAIAYARRKLWVEARAAIELILAQKPDNFAALINLCEFRLEAGELPEAARLLERMEKLFPGNSRVRLARGELALREGKTAEAIDSIRSGIRGTAYFYRWELKRGYGLLAEALAAEGRQDESRLQRLLEENISRESDAYTAFMPLAEGLIARHDLETASRVLEELKRMFPGNTRVAVAAGELLLLKGYPLEAVRAIAARLPETPDKFAADRVRGYLVLSRAYQALGDWEQSRRARKRAAALRAELGG